MSKSFSKQSESKRKPREENSDLKFSAERPENQARSRSKSFELTKRSDSRSNSALRRTPKITNESVEKELSSYF